ncbi:MAG: SurA N-terminal domain-containing protein [Alistipes sp.]|nr:SurA N-terminal domain-containing protein [Alistipes sp.]
MLSLNNLRTKLGVVLSIIIGVTLLAFVLGDFLGNRNQGKDPVVGEINGEEIPYSTFYAAYEEMRALNGNDNANYDQSAQLISMTWQTLLFDRVLAPNMEKLGLVVTPAEREKMLKGEISSNVLNAIFGVNGQYDPAMLSSFLQGSEEDAQRQYIWNLLEKQIYTDRMTGKYMDLVRSGAYANALMVENGLVAENNTYKGRYVACNYSSVADSLVTVSNSEIKKYYEANKANYKQTPYRTVRYAHFENEPSDSDKAAVETLAKTTAADFAATKDVAGYVVGKSYASLAGSFVSEESLPSDEAKALRAGKMFGPELQGDEWYASRVAETLLAPKSVELQQIALPRSEEKLADSLYIAAKVPGANFASLAPQGSFAEVGEVSCSMLPAELAKKLANAKANDVVKVSLGGAIQIFKVLKVDQKARHYRLATQTHHIYASKATKDALYKEVCDFSRNAKGTLEGFNEAAASVPTSSMNINKTSRNVPGLANSIEVVRWANEAEVGDVSDIIKLGEDYVVAVVTAIDEEEYKSLDKAASEIKPLLMAQKKAAILKEKMQGADVDAIAANAGVKVKEFSGAKTSSNVISGIGMEPRVIGALGTVTAENKGKLLPLIEGKSGVYAIIVDEVTVADTQSAEAERVKAQAQTEAMAANRAMWAVNQAANLVDGTVRYF